MTPGPRSAGDEHPERPAADTHEAQFAAMLGDLYGGRAAEPTRQPTDAALTESVQRALDAEPTLGPGQVCSSVQDGWVRLEGQAASAAARQEAGRAALELEGVQGVDNQVRLSDR